MTGVTLAEMPQILYRVKIHKSILQSFEKNEILEHPWVNYGFDKFQKIL